MEVSDWNIWARQFFHSSQRTRVTVCCTLRHKMHYSIISSAIICYITPYCLLSLHLHIGVAIYITPGVACVVSTLQQWGRMACKISLYNIFSFGISKKYTEAFTHTHTQTNTDTHIHIEAPHYWSHVRGIHLCTTASPHKRACNVENISWRHHACRIFWVRNVTYVPRKGPVSNATFFFPCRGVIM